MSAAAEEVMWHLMMKTHAMRMCVFILLLVINLMYNLNSEVWHVNYIIVIF